MRDPKVLVVYRERASDRRALTAAVDLGAPLTVVALAPKEVRSARCGFYSPALDLAVRSQAEHELHSAREQLGERAHEARFLVLETNRDDELARWAAGAGITTALLGARRAFFGVHPRAAHARALSRAGVDVRIVD